MNFKKEIPLSGSSKIFVTKDTVNDRTFGQVRIWVKRKDDDEYKPTKKGIAFDLSKTGQIAQALLELQDELPKA